MEKNQSEQPIYISNLASPSIISPAQFPCTVISSNKTAIHTIVPNNSNPSYRQFQNNASNNDLKNAQNIPSSIFNCYTRITTQSDEFKYSHSNNSKIKKPSKRNMPMKTSQCLNSNDNSSDITAAPNQLTILVQEVLPAQVPDNPVLTSSAIPPPLNAIKAHSSNIISASQMNEKKLDLSNKEVSPEKIDIGNFLSISKDSETIQSVVPNQSNFTNDARDTISEVIKEVLIKALSNDPHEDVFLSVIKSRENVSRPFTETVDGLELSSSISSPILSQMPDNPLVQLSIPNNIPFQRHPEICRPNINNNNNKTISATNFIHPQFISQTEIKPVTNDIKSNIIAQSYPKSEFYPANCQINQKPNLIEESIHQNLESGSKPVNNSGNTNNKRRNASIGKSSNKKQKLSTDPIYHEKLNNPLQRCQQSMAKQLGQPNFRKLVHEPRIKNNLTCLVPLGCKQRTIQCSDIFQLQDNCVKYKRVPFTMPQINPIHFNNSVNRSTENSFILQNINASIPEGGLLSVHESDDIDYLIPPSPNNNELDYLSVFNCDPISSPSVSLSGGPNLEMLHPPNRNQSPQLSVFHCPNKDYLKFDHLDLSLPCCSSSSSSSVNPITGSMSSLSRKTIDPQSVLRPTGISRVQISAHKYSSVPSTPTAEPIPENALIDSETGEIVSKPVNDQIRPTTKSREKILMTFTINPPDDVEKTVRNITDVLGIDYNSVEFKETNRGGEIAIDKDSIVSNSIPKEICERYNTSVVVNNSTTYKFEPSSINSNSSITTKTFDNHLISSSSSSFDKLSSTELPLYSEKVYKSTSLLNKTCAVKCSNCDKSIPEQKLISNNNVVLCDRIKFRDLSFCDEACQQEYSMMADDETNTNTNINTNSSSKCSDIKDQILFVGEDLCDASVIVQGSISKSKQISKRLGALINDKLLKKKASIIVPSSVKLSSLSSSSSILSSNSISTTHKIHKGSKYYLFHSSAISEPSTSIISESQFHRLSVKSKSVLRQSNLTDKRICSLCHRSGDLAENGPGRLLCFSANKWLHINCALWCNNVFEMQCGALNNVPESFETSLKSICNSCGKPGAGIACYYPRCTLKYHVPCAQENRCLFYADRAMYCQLHQTKDLGPHLSSLNVDRRVYISRDEYSQVAGTINNEEDDDQNFFLRIGSLIVLSIGQLLPHQIHSGNFHNLNHVYPTGFKSRRIHWSSRVLNSRSVYECEILMDKDQTMPMFKVTAKDENMDNEYYFGSTCSETWRKILKKISNLRKTNRIVKIFPEHIKAEDLYGLTEPHVLRAIESLPGLESLSDYAFKFGKMQLIVEMPLPVNLSGSIRTEPFIKLSRHHHKPVIHQSPTFMRHLLSTIAKQDSNSNSASLYNKTTLSSKWQQYRKLKFETKFNVVLKRSKIQGFGLYAAKDLEKGTMIIEYVGELIRNEVANIREKQYESKKQGIYMFRLDPLTVIDATRAGDLARYINHCCDPNCFTDLLDFEKESHIVIISNRKIEKGEELTYDYKFDLDDGKDDKIPCLCGSRNCKRWMN